MDIDSLQGMLQAIITPLLEEECVELIETKVARTHRGFSLLFLVDRPKGGITLDICARLNRRIGDLLESRDEIEGSYLIEVSSPGLDRNLKNKADFDRCLGKQVKFFLNEMIGGKLEWDAEVRAAGEESVEVDARGMVLGIPYVKINKSRLIL